MQGKLHSHRHCVYNLSVHVVVGTKYSRKVISKEMLERLKEVFSSLCSNQKSELIEFGGEPDHVHLLIDLSPDVAVSKLINTRKTISSRLIRKEFSDHLNQFYWKPVFWSGAPKRYIIWWCASRSS